MSGRGGSLSNSQRMLPGGLNVERQNIKPRGDLWDKDFVIEKNILEDFICAE